MTTTSWAAGGEPPDAAKPATAEPAKKAEAEPAKAEPAKPAPKPEADKPPAKKPEAKPVETKPEPSVVRKTSSDVVDTTKWHLTPRLTLFIAYAPLVGAAVPGLTIRKAIKADSPLTNNSYISFGLDVPVNPTLIALRPNIEFAPLAILRITMAYWGIWQTGIDMNGGHSLSVADRFAPTDKPTWEDRGGEGAPRWSHRFTFNVRLQAAVANLVALVVETEADAWYVPREPQDGNDEFLYHSLYDNLIRLGRVDGGIMNRSLLLFYAWRSEAKASLLVGVVNEYVKMFAANRERNRLGAAVVFNVGEEIDEIQRMQVTLMGGVNLLDTNYQYDPWVQLVIRMYWDELNL